MYLVLARHYENEYMEDENKQKAIDYKKFSIDDCTSYLEYAPTIDEVENLNYEIDDFKLNIEKEYACLHPISKDSRNKSDSNFFPRSNKEGC